MEMKGKALKKLIDEYFEGSYNKCARNIDLAPSTVCRIANGTGKAGIKTITNVINYCSKNGINYHKYINLS